jgi:quinolinate synthase
MIDFVRDHPSDRVVLLTECSMSDNVAAEFPNVEFVRPCNLCPHMKRNTLPKVLRALETLEPQITIEATVSERARGAVQRMIDAVAAR